ncbi:hypothetical protein OK016_14475 [Vibrio chagasii]|nr:hypothetical protein [Vibrio chagasii]
MPKALSMTERQNGTLRLLRLFLLQLSKFNASPASNPGCSLSYPVKTVICYDLDPAELEGDAEYPQLLQS